MAMATSSTDEGSGDPLCIYSHANSAGYFIILTDQGVSVTLRSQNIGHVLLEDVLGVETLQCKGTRVDLTVNAFPITRKLFRGETRWRMKLIHCFDSEDPAENKRLAKQWKQKIVIESRRVIQKKYNWYYEGKQLNYNNIMQ